MKNKQYLQLVSILIVLLLAGSAVIMVKEKKGQKFMQLNGSQFKVEVVSDREQLQKGLGGRSSLCKDCGMLFQFSAPGNYAFWMKDMRFDLDIIWLLDHKIVFMKKNVPFDAKQAFSPAVNADQVLEINAGLSDKLGLQIGDSMQLQ